MQGAKLDKQVGRMRWSRHVWKVGGAFRQRLSVTQFSSDLSANRRENQTNVRSLVHSNGTASTLQTEIDTLSTELNGADRKV